MATHLRMICCGYLVGVLVNTVFLRLGSGRYVNGRVLHTLDATVRHV